MNIMPAYGRSYDNKQAVLNDWEKGLDFRVHGGPYLNKSDWKIYGSLLDSLTFHYKGLSVFIQVGMI